MANYAPGSIREIRDVELTIQEGERTETPEPVRAFLALAYRRWRTIHDAEDANRQEMVEDLRFRASDQWPDTVMNNRQADGRPTLTVNRLPEFIRQVTNAQRQNRPAIKVSPVDSNADIETAEVFQGVIRHIEERSNADVAYTNAGDDQATMGRGYWRILTEYANDKTMDQRICIKQIANPFSVYVDVACQEPDKSDARFAFVIEDMPKEEFKVKYPNAPMSSLTEMATLGDFGQDWLPEGKVRIAEYFYVDYEKRELREYARRGGERVTMFKEEWEELNASGRVDDYGDSPLMWEQIGQRTVNERTIKWAKISAAGILEGNEQKTEGRVWPGKFIPIVTVIGDEIDINGQKDYRGMVRDARDPQRMVNYWESALTEAIALAPKAPFVVAKGQIENMEDQWNSANTRNWPYLQYNPVSSDGKPVPPPQRQTFEPAIAAISEAAMHADQNLKNVLGFHAASLGDLSGSERSGKAIQALQKQAELGASSYLDNLGRAIRYSAEILVDLIPKVLTSSRVMRILGKDDQVMGVALYSGVDNRPMDIDENNLPPGIRGIYDLEAGEFDVTVQVGRSFETRRQEAVATITDLVKAFPEAAPLAMDIMVENMDVPWGQQLSERMKMLLPPEVQQQELSDLPPAAQAMVNQLQGQLQELQQLAEQQGQQIATDEHKERVKGEIKAEELKSRERIAAGKDATTAKTNVDDNDTMTEIAELRAQVDLLIARMKDAREGEKLDLEEEKLEHDADKTMIQEGNKYDIAEAGHESAAKIAKSKPTPAAKKKA